MQKKRFFLFSVLRINLILYAKILIVKLSSLLSNVFLQFEFSLIKYMFITLRECLINQEICLYCAII